MSRIKYVVQAAVIAAIYAVLTIFFTFSSYGLIQVRVAEALTVLPFFTPAAIPGLFAGCIIANIFSPNGMADVIVGSLATLTAAILSRRMPRRLVPVPPIAVNAVAVGIMLSVLLNFPLWLSVLYVAAGQVVACYGLGYPLLLLLQKFRDRIF